MFSNKVMIFYASILGAAIIVSHNWATDLSQVRGDETDSKATMPPSPYRLVVAGPVDLLRKPTNNTFIAYCGIPGNRNGIIIRNLKVDAATLILRRSQDGRFDRVDLGDIFQGKVPENIVASVAPLADPKDHTHLVYWLVVKPQNVKSPVPEEVIEEPNRVAPPSSPPPIAPTNPKPQPSPPAP